MTIEEFARLSRERDLRVGAPTSSLAIYLEEAEHYLTLKQKDWPCDILESIGQHTPLHGKECLGESRRDP